MEQVLIKAAQLLLSLSILVVLHEFGHFAFARLFKTRVEKFYLFFDPWFALFKTKKGDTEYGIGWLPLGGYVKISGMIDESMDKDAMKLPPQDWEFRSKKPYQRLLIMLGGVMMNFIFAFIIYIGVLFAWGEQYLPTENAIHGIVVNEIGEQIGLQNGDRVISVDNIVIENFHRIIPTVILDNAKTIQVERKGEITDVQISDDDLALLIKSKQTMSFRYLFNFVVDGFSQNSIGKTAGLEKGDKLLAINEHEFTYYDEFQKGLKANADKEINLSILRNGKEEIIQMQLDERALIGIMPEANILLQDIKFKTLEYGFMESIPAGFKRGITTIQDYLKQFKLIFSSKTKGYESLGGFIAIGNIFPGAWDWYSFWNMTAFLSIILAVMNLLPIPALDGGHVTFLLYEIISGRKPGDKFLEYAQIGGMILLLTLVVYANANDIIKLFN